MNSSIRMILFVAVLLLSLSCGGRKLVKETPESGRIHTAPEILKIMEQSRLVYKIDMLDSTETVPLDTPQALTNQFYLETNGENSILKLYELEGAAKIQMDEAEAAFEDGNYAEALRRYKEVYRIQPGYHYALTMCGDVFFMEGEADSAVAYFKEAVAQNPVDYSAYWFLADTYWKMGKKKLALENISRAHLLNKFNPRLTERLKYYREQNNQPWQDWSFVPQYTLSKSGHTVDVKVRGEWIGYALVKALWKYEPGYAESMTGSAPDENSFTLKEESEAVLSLISGKTHMDRIKKIVEDGYLEEFFYYEIAANKNPAVLLLISQADRDRVLEYINKFH